MIQVLQDLTNGNTSVVEAPAPQISPGNILIHTTTTLISAGTERMLVGFGKASLIDKARQQPDKVKMVLEVDLPRPRDFETVTSPPFILLKAKLLAALREETVQVGAETWP